MAKEKKARRSFGNVRELPSGRWQARYLGPDGIERKARTTFATEKEADNWLTIVQAEILRNDWSAPELGESNLDEYAVRWISERKLAPRTRENYEDLHRLHIGPHLGEMSLGDLKPATIRTWRKRLLDSGTTEPQAVKAYRLLRAVLNTAMKEDGLIKDNPCRIKGYDKYHTPERPTATVDQVFALADAVPERYRAFIIVAAFSGLRWGELVALRRCDVDLVEGASGCIGSSQPCGAGWSSVRRSRRPVSGR
ncbi:tyrosine-type recombinase/integrase [Dactylosporangium sp. CA-139114]|uniref:tyrosine-type recombinase/integrase n=1 Tax=Dactylosporangium sp. CA-139114 TaxID=3239931 RepID=UPI003D99F6B4